MGTRIVSLLSLIGGGGGSLPPKVILVAADFPTTIEANANMGRIYIAGAAVTDNDPTKTNTGQSFISGQEFVWDGVSAYVILGDVALWTDDGTDLSALNARNINLKNNGLKDTNVTTAIKLGDALNTSFSTTNKTIAGAINELLSQIFLAVEDILTVSTPGQTAFTLSDTPSSDAAFALYLNGQLRIFGTDYTRSGTSLTWLDPGGLTLLTTDSLIARYNDGASGSAVLSVFSRTGNIVAAASDYDASQVDNDSGVSGSFVSDALDQLDTDIGTVSSNLSSHTGSANPHTGSAANGANSDITSLSGLTTPLSIAQGGTNSNTALTNGKVIQSSGGKLVESTVDISSLSATKSYITPAEPSANYNNRRVRAIGATGAFRMNFSVPKNFTGTLAIKLIGYPVSGAGGTGKDIDLTGEYTNSAGASATQYTFSDTTSTYNTGTDDARMELDITSLFTNLAAGSEGGILVDHKGIGGTINYLGVEITST